MSLCRLHLEVRHSDSAEANSYSYWQSQRLNGDYDHSYLVDIFSALTRRIQGVAVLQSGRLSAVRMMTIRTVNRKCYNAYELVLVDRI